MSIRIIILMSALLVTVDTFSQSGECGLLATWSFDGNTLTISGTGSFNHYGAGGYDAYRNKIQRVIIRDGITMIGDCAFDGYMNIKSIEIPSSVTSIGFSAISGCINLTSLIIPNSVSSMSGLAVWNMPNLQTLTIPDKSPTRTGSGSAPFFWLTSSSSLQTVGGNDGTNPRYIVASLPAPMSKQFKDKSFYYFAETKVKEQLTKWATKGEFENTAQWHQRVNDTTYKEEVDKLVEQVKRDFVKEKSPRSVNGSLQTYDADQEAFPIKLSDSSTVYVGVPLSDASSFKSKWNSVKMKPTWGIVNDRIAMISCSFKLGRKKYGLLTNYNEDTQDLTLNLPEFHFDADESEPKQSISANGISSDIVPTTIDKVLDTSIPVGTSLSTHTFAVIIGNENYQRVAHVQYAGNDAKVFVEYCHKTLGLPQNNIRSYKDATYGTMLAALKDIQGIAKAYKGDIDVIFYYAGHGIPNENDQSAYLLPVDADGTQIEVCLSTKKLYQALNKLNARQVVVLMDACFSGAQRGYGMLAASRGIALKVKDDIPQGNMVVFTAANGQQTAYPYKEKGHGMFTYFILKKLQETKGDVTLGELCDYVSQQVAQQSIVINRKPQTPTIIPSNDVVGKWEKWRLE